MKKIAKLRASGIVKRLKAHFGMRPGALSGAGDAAPPPARRRRRSIAPASPQERVDMAFLAALMSLPDQRARGLASDALTRHGPGAEDPRKSAREIVEAAGREKWEDWRSLAVLAEYGGMSLKRGLGKKRARR